MATERIIVPQPLPIGGGRSIAAPFQFITSGEDNLRITVVNAAAGVRVAVQGRRVDRDGRILPLAHTVAATSDRLAVTRIFPLGVGALLNLAVWAEAGAPVVGQTFVIVQVVRGLEGGTELLGTLMQGYVTSTQGLGWPGSPIVSSTEGEPFVRAIRGTAPAAATDLSETVPTGARWELLAIRFNIATSAVAGTRYVGLVANDGVIGPWLVVSQRVINPSEVRAYTWAQGLSYEVSDTIGHAQSGIPRGALLRAGSVIRSNVYNMQAGDQVFAPDLLVREWLEVT
jgi:hypothetical protein